MPTFNYRTNPIVRVDYYPLESYPTIRGHMLVLHGGGWSGGDRGGKAGDIAKKAAKNGYPSFSADYRLTPGVRWPEIMEDIETVIAWIRANYPVTKLVGWGWSAGAHLMAEACNRGIVAGAVIGSGPLDLTNRPTNPDIDALTLNSGLAAASPILNITTATKPMFLSYGDDDPNIPQPDGLAWFNALQAMRPANDLWRPYDGGHTWDNTSDTFQKNERGFVFNTWFPSLAA